MIVPRCEAEVSYLVEDFGSGRNDPLTVLNSDAGLKVWLAREVISRPGTFDD